MRVIETKVYTFDELSEPAKERARDWYREVSAGDNYFAEHVLEEAENFGAILGIEFRQLPVRLRNGATKHEPAIYYSGFSSQGDGACFEGHYSYRPGSVRAIAAQVPTGDGPEMAANNELNRIARELAELQRTNGYKLSAAIEKTDHHYAHPYTVRVTVSKGDDEADAATSNALAELLRAFMQWIYRGLETEYEYQNSAEAVDETIRANEYEFTEDGKRT